MTCRQFSEPDDKLLSFCFACDGVVEELVSHDSRFVMFGHSRFEELVETDEELNLHQGFKREGELIYFLRVVGQVSARHDVCFQFTINEESSSSTWLAYYTEKVD